MKTIDTSEINVYVEAASKSPNLNIMLLGDTGVGKTQSIQKYAKENGRFLKKLILSQLDASEALGIPVPFDKVHQGNNVKMITSAIPEWVYEMIEHKDEKPILFLDEFLTADPSVMNSFLTFLSDKEVGHFDLSFVQIVAATNIDGYVFQPAPNILSRFSMFYVENLTYKEYLTNKYGKEKLANFQLNYKDEVDKSGILFESRSLKPRCLEQLLELEKEFYAPFYEGFTNEQMFPMLSSDEKLNDILLIYVKQNENGVHIPDDSITNLAAAIKAKYPRAKKFDMVLSKIDTTILEIHLELLNDALRLS